jgi:dephospho-CoA kinase
MSRSIVYGLTGGIACGKSTVARILCDLGAVVIDADQISRDVVQPGSAGLSELCETFGIDILDEQGALDRPKLGSMVFAQPSLRKQLESIVHPLIAVESLRQIERAKQSQVPMIVYEAALLVETKRANDFRPLIVVWCSSAEQKARLKDRDGLDSVAAQLRLDSQMPIEEKIKHADILIENNGTRTQLNEAVSKVWSDVNQND